MSKQASDRNQLPSSASATLRVASMGENPLPPSSSSSTLNRSVHGSLTPFSSTLNPAASAHRSLLPSSSSSNLNPSASIHGSFLPSLWLWPFSNYQNSLSTGQIPMMPSFENHTKNFAGTLFYSNLSGQNYTGWSAPFHYQQAYRYGHQFYTAPPPHSPPWPQPSPPRLYIDPVGPMLPSIPPSMRIMNFSASRQETILFEELFQECRQKPIDVVVVDDEEENVKLELMPGGRATKRPKVDLTLTIKPPAMGVRIVPSPMPEFSF